MKSLIFCIVVILYTAMGCSNIQGQEHNAIVRMEIVSMSFKFLTRGAWSFKQLWATEHPSYKIFRDTITDSAFLQAINQRLIVLEPIEFTGMIDHRIACKIFRENGRVDELGISALYFALNGKYYQRDDGLFRLIADRLPTSHRTVIYEFFIDRREEIRRQKEAGTYKEPEPEDWEKEQDE